MSIPTFPSQLAKKLLLFILIMITGCKVGQINPGTNGIAISTVTPNIPTSPVNSSPPSGDLKQFAWFYKPPPQEQYATVIKDFDVFILTNHDEPEREQMRADGLIAPVYQYLLLAEIQDPGSCQEIPYGNQVANRPGDFCEISEKHPDWFLLDKFGKRIQNGEGYYYMDPGQPGFRAFWLERAREIQVAYKWDGLFLDNVEASLSKYQKMFALPEKYPDNASLTLAVEGFLKYLDENYFMPENRPAIANIISVNDQHVWYRYLQYLDGAMLENFAVNWQGYFSREDWEQQISLIAATQNMNKTALLVSQGSQNDLQRQEFSFASYLLIADGQTSFRYTHHSAYDEIWWYPNYETDLGKPLDSLRQESEVWIRDFEHGYVTVNPTNNTGKIVITP